MSDSTTTADEPLDYSFLLFTHMVCADQQIHNKELKYLQELEQQIGVGERTKQEKEKILAQDEHLIPVDVLAQGMRQMQRNGAMGQAMRQMLTLAYIDGFYSPLEHQMVERVGRIWNWSLEEIQRFVKYEEAHIAVQPIQDESSSRDSLWDDRDYETATRQCAEIAREDYTFAEAALQATGATLDNLRQGIQHSIQGIGNKTTGNARAETAKEVAQQLETTKQSLKVEIVKKVKSVRESLDAKQRALNYFTIAFMGKTKAGKSTLHAVMTDEGWDAIGVGKQRTTRLNRVYEWKKIRIIDTPGMGAPGGKTDEEIAKSVIDESDVICYVVTNDSIQETEFEFLRLLKENAKPVIILLNVKNNLRDPRRLEHFLKNPDKLFAMDGQTGLGGHIERIRRYAKDHYANGYFEIVPVMLLAAQLSSEPEHQHHKAELFKASQMQNFFDKIRLSLVDYGAIRRSQNLLGCTVGNVNNPYYWVTQQAEVYQKLTDKLKKKRDEVRRQIKTAQKDALESLQLQIEAIFQDALNVIPSFAEDYWNSSESDLTSRWEQKLKEIQVESRLEIEYQEAGKTFNKKVQEAIEEVGNELQLIAKLGGLEFSFSKQDTDDERMVLLIGGGILALVGTVMAFVPPLAAIGLVISIVAGVISFIGGFIKSKEQKRREAVQNISSSLCNQINNQQKTTLDQAVEQLRRTCEDMTANVDTYLKQLIEGLEEIAQQLESAQSKLDQTANDLNLAYAKRIIDWCLKRDGLLTRESIEDVIVEVNRDFGRSMSIKTKSFLQLQITQDEVNSVLQEDISIQIATSPTPAEVKSPNIQIPTSPIPEVARNPKRKFLGVVGIDLGTTNSAVAVMKYAQPMVLTNKEGFTSTPSVVAYTQGGACLVGQTAKHQAIMNPENTFDSVMRVIGCKYDEVTEKAKQVPYRVLRDTQGRVKIDCPVLGQQFAPEEILAQVLRKLADDASQRLDGQVTKVVITVPAYFNEIQRHAVKDAGSIAGLEVLRIISNPTAAALAYGLNKKDNETILVFDLGGGHFSVSILKIGDGVFEVLVYSGDTQLGGNDFDQKIMDWLGQEFTQLESIGLHHNSQALQRLREAAEKAKIEISSATQTEIDLPWLTTTAFGSKHLKMTLTRYKFGQLCADLVNRCHSSLDNALREAKLDKSAIDEVILVGGSTRIPAVQEFLRQFFGKEPKHGFNSNESVALGAAVQAAVLSGKFTGIV